MPSSRRLPYDLAGQHAVHRKVLADVAEEVQDRHRPSPVQVVDDPSRIVAAEIDDTSQPAPDALDPSGHRLSAVEGSLAGLLGVADHARRPAHQKQRPMAGSLQDPGHNELHQVAEVDARSSRVEADIEGDRPGSQDGWQEPLRRWTRPAGHATSVPRARRSRVKCATETSNSLGIPNQVCRPSSARRLATSSSCSRTRGRAVPPRPARLLIEPLTLSTERTSEVRCGEISARSSALRSVSPALGLATPYARARDLVCLGERHPLAYQPVGDVGGQREPHGGKALQPFTMEGQGRNQSGDRRQHDQQLVDRVEDRLLVLLQVTVVRQRQSFQSREQARSGCRSIVRPCLAPARRHRGSSSAA